MKILSPFSENDLKEEFKDEIQKQGRKLTWIADQMGITKGHLSNILNNATFKLTSENRQKLNELLKTNI